MKNLYLVQFNWHGEVLSFFTQATNEMEALRNALWVLAENVKWSLKSVREYILDRNACRWEIRKGTLQ